MAEERFATKEEILKNLKKAYNAHRLTYKQYMVEVNRTEKHYDEWVAEYKESKEEESKYDMTNEELAIGKRMEELQAKPITLQEQEEEKLSQIENEENKEITLSEDEN